MKVLLIKLLCLALSISFILPATSCRQKDNDNEEESVKVESWDEELIISDPENAEYEYFFDSVEALLYAIKREPDKYNGATIKVVGTIYKSLDETLLVDFTATSENVPSSTEVTGDSLLKMYNIKNSNNRINIMISNDAQYAVAETGDYVKIYGTLKITRDSIYINNCEYDLIASFDERIEIIRDK